MQRRNTLLISLFILFTSGLLAHWWLSTGMSESVWTWVNGRVEGGRNPGRASDIELLATLAGSLLVSASGALLIHRLSARMRGNAKGDGVIRQHRSRP